MIKLYNEGIFLKDGYTIIPESQSHYDKNEAKKGTIAYHIMNNHNMSNNMEHLRIKFDSMASHDITYVGIIQTARASGMKKFPLPYVMTCCHNSLCAVGGTINDDDHLFGLSAAKKYGGIYVPPHIAVIHQYMRENFAGCGKMILGSDSHTRYGALGTMAIGEGGGELVKQLLEDTYDIDLPDVIAVYLDGKPHPWVGPHDIALAIIREVFKNGYVKNKVMEFVGPGISTIDTDYRNGIDVMTTETTCLSSIWRTDEDTHDYLKEHHREADYKTLNPDSIAYYEGCVYVDLSTIKPMIALPFHPSHAYEIDELYENLIPILKETEEAATKVSEGKAHFTLLDKVTSDGKLMVQQGVIGGCSGGTYSNIVEAAHALKEKTIGNDEFYLSIYPSSQPVYTDLDRKGFLADLMDSGALIRSAFCGPCFGAGDIPANNAISIRHNTRNFPNREGSKPGQGQMSAVALMDARSIAATAANGGILTSAEHLDIWGDIPEYHYNDRSYQSRVYNGFNHPDNTKELRYGPNIKDWPKLGALTDHILLKTASKIEDEVTTTDELIPSGETSSYRSNPLGLAEFTLSRRDPLYVQRSKSIRDLEQQRCLGHTSKSLENIFNTIKSIKGFEALNPLEVEIGSVLYANKPGDGSAREQAASCQRVLGGLANITQEYATKRYRSNCINWGILPFHLKGQPDNLKINDYIFVPNIKEKLTNSLDNIPAYIIREDSYIPIFLYILDMTDNEKEILKAGSLINYNRNKQ